MLAAVSKELPRSTPADEHVDPGAVLAFVGSVDADPAIELHSLMVVRHGRVVAEGWWAPHTPERTRLLYSLSKCTVRGRCLRDRHPPAAAAVRLPLAVVRGGVCRTGSWVVPVG